MTESFLKVLPLASYLIVLLTPLIILAIDARAFTFIFFLYVLYGIIKSASLLLGTIVGYYRFKYESRINWKQKLLSTNESLPNQLIAIPVYKEDFSIIARCLDSIVTQNYDTEKLFVSISIEENLKFNHLKEQILCKYESIFKNRILVVQHILQPDEVKGAASNRTYAVKEFLRQTGLKVEDFLVTSPDADTVFNQQYFSRIAYQWIIDGYSYNVFYQTGAYKFDNNLRKVPLMVRIVSIGISLGTLSSAVTENKYRYTFSCFTIPLRTLIDINFWDISISIDDTPLYWRAFDYFKGNFECRTFYIPISVDAIDSKNYFDAHVKQYRQIHRWGWGVIVFPSAIRALLKSETNFTRKLISTLYFFDISVFLKAMPASIIFYLLLINTSNFLSTISYISFVFLVVGSPWVFKFSLENSKMSLLTALTTILFFLPMGLVNIYLYCLIPFFHAAIEFAFGMNVVNRINWSIKLPEDA